MADEDVTSGYFYDDEKKHPMLIEIGMVGYGSKPDQDEVLRLYPPDQRVDGKVRPMVVEGDTSPAAAECKGARQQYYSSSVCTLNLPPVVEFIWFGKSHRFPLTEYSRLAPIFRDRLFAEARILTRSIQGDQAVAYEFLEGDGSLGAWMTSGIQDVKDTFKKLLKRVEEIPKASDYDALQDRAFKAWHKVHEATADDYDVIHETGIEFERIRFLQRRLTHRVLLRVGALVDSAGQGEAGAEWIENKSFTVLDLYGQVRFASNPAGLAAYRVGVMIVRSGAHGVGEFISDDDERDPDAVRRQKARMKAALRAGLEQVEKTFPGIVTDLIMAYVKKGLGEASGPKWQKALSEQVIGLQVFTVSELIVFYCFDADSIPKSEVNDKFLEQFIPKLVTKLVHAILEIIKSFFPESAYESGSYDAGDAERAEKRKWIDRIGNAFIILLGAAFEEMDKAKKTATQEKRPLMDVVLADLGWILIRCLKKLAMKLWEQHTEEKYKKWISDKYEAEQKDPVKCISDYLTEYIRASLLSYKISTAKLDPSKLPQPAPHIGEAPEATPPLVPPAPLEPQKVSGNGKLTKPSKIGPDADGTAGMHKHETSPKLMPPAPPPKASDRAKKPKKEKRKDKLAKNLIPPQVAEKKVVLPPPPEDQKDLRDIRANFKFDNGCDQSREKTKYFKRVEGELGVPGTVVAVRDETAQKRVSGGTGDDAGHLAGTQFGAPGDERNLSAQNKWQNEGGGTYHELEERWATLLKQGKRVRVNISDYSTEQGARPMTRTVRYWVDDEEQPTVDYLNTTTPEGRAKTGGTPAPTGKLASVSNINARAASWNARVGGLEDAAVRDGESEGYTILHGEKGVIGGRSVTIYDYTAQDQACVVGRKGGADSKAVLVAAARGKDIGLSFEAIEYQWSKVKDEVKGAQPEFVIYLQHGEAAHASGDGMWVKEGVLMNNSQPKKLGGTTIRVVELKEQSGAGE